jgi:spore germination protein YaaH
MESQTLPPKDRRWSRPWLVVALAVLVGGPSLLAPVGAAAIPADVATPVDAGARQAAAGGTPGAPGDDATGNGAGDATDPGAVPTIQYLQAEEHAKDRIDFTPGDRVTVPFTPRVGDAWQVDGQSPRALPPGHANGKQMRDEAPDAIWAAGAPTDIAGSDPSAPVDEPSSDAPAADGRPASMSVSASGDAPSSATAIGASGLRREIFGFLPYWVIGDSTTTIDYRTLSTIAYFSVGCLQSGSLDKYNPDGSSTTGWAGWTSSKMTSIITAAHKANTRVVLTISCFAWSSAGATRQARMLGSATARSRFAKAAAAAVRDRGADGINLDFEPIVAGYSDDFTLLVRSIRTELNRIHSGYQLTFDAMGSIGNQPIANATAPGGADAVFVMGYDYRTASSSVAGSISPLSGPHYDLTDTVKAFTAKVSPSKVILGVPYYGRAWSTASDSVNASTLDPTRYGSSAAPTYAQAMDQVALHGRRYDSVEQAPWTAYRKQTCTSTGCLTAWRELYYDDAASLRLRYDLVNRSALRGVGIWAIGYDGTRPELRQALADKFLTDTTPPIAGIATLAPQQRDESFGVGWAGWDDSGIAFYDVQVSVNGGAWAPWMTRTKLTSSLYPGVDGRTYVFRVRATDVHGNVSAFKSLSLANLSAPSSIRVGGFATVVTDGLRMRNAPSTGASVMATLGGGDALQVIGGPVAGEGYTWYEVAGPVMQWAPVDAMQVGGWVAASGNGATNVQSRRPVYTTIVHAGITNLQLANGGQRVVPANGTVRVEWTNHLTFDSVRLREFRPDGTVLGSVGLGGTSSGDHAYNWDGRVGGARVPDGVYVLQLQGIRGSFAYNAPSVSPVSGAGIATFGVVVSAAAPTSVLAFSRPVSPTSAHTLTWKLTFGGPVAGLRSTDFARSGSATGCVVGTPAGSGANWTVTLTGCSAGTVTLGLQARAVVDAVRNWGPTSPVNAQTLFIDRTAPTAAAPKMGLRIGASLASAVANTGLLANLAWSAIDHGGAGVASYDLRKSVDGATFANFASATAATGIALALPPGHTYQFEVRARDKAGNVGGWVVGPVIHAYLPQESYAGPVWKGTWTSASLAQCSGGSVRFATAAGAGISYSFTGRAIGWVTTLGPDRGSAKVYVDGVLVTTVDLHATGTTYRRVAFAKSWSSSATHMLRIVVVGTTGHPRVDVDAFEVLR